MPVTPTPAFQWVISAVQIDMVNVQCGVTLVGQLATTPTPTPVQGCHVDFTIPTADFTALITAVPTTGLTRQNDLTQAIYNYAVSKGIVSGTVS